MSDRKDFTADVGETFTLSLNYTQPNGSPVDLTGYTATMIVHTIGNPAANRVEYPGVVAGPSGVVTFTVADEVTALWVWNSAAYRVVVESPAGDRTRLLQGVLFADRG